MTVLSGASHLGHGDTLDWQSAQRLPAGSHFSLDWLPSAAKAMIRDNAEALKAELLASNFEPFPTAEARSFPNPVLLLYGERTFDFFCLISDRLRALLPNAETATTPGASHDMHSDNPEAYNEEVLRFLGKYSEAPRAA